MGKNKIRIVNWAVATLLFTAITPVWGQRDIDIGEIRVHGDREDVLNISIESDSSDLRRLAETAFNAHGRFNVSRERSGTHFTFAFNRVGERRVEVEIFSGRPPRSLFSETVRGDSQRNALFRAADVAVRQTTGDRGIFAGRLVFIGERTGNREVYTSDLFTGGMVQITNDGAKSVLPRWAPDGRSIIYTGYFQSGFPDLFRINLADRSREPFVQLRGTNTGARYNPQGNRIAMVLSGEGSPEIYLSNAEGRRIRRLTRTDGNVQSSPTWSPDGRRLAFTSDRDGRPQIFQMPVSGGNMQRIPTNISRHCTEPDWNPRHSNLIAFTAAVDRRFAIALYNFETRESEFLTRGPADAVQPVWTADGRHLVYTERTARTSRLMLLDTETGHSAPLSSNNRGKLSQADYWIE